MVSHPRRKRGSQIFGPGVANEQRAACGALCPGPQTISSAPRCAALAARGLDRLRTAARSPAAKRPGLEAAVSARGGGSRDLPPPKKLCLGAPGREKPATVASLPRRRRRGQRNQPDHAPGARQAAVFSRLGASVTTPSSDSPDLSFQGISSLDSSLCPTGEEWTLIHTPAGESELRARWHWGLS